MLQCVAKSRGKRRMTPVSPVCCSVQQYAALCCQAQEYYSVLQYAALYCRVQEQNKDDAGMGWLR